MQKEQNALIIMFIIVIVICGGFLLLKKTNINLDFFKKEQETKQEPVEKDYSPYKGVYVDLSSESIKLEIISITQKSIDFSITTIDEGEKVTIIEKQLGEVKEDQYNFTYKDSYNNTGKGSIILEKDYVLLSLDTDIPDTNLSHLGLGNFRNLKLYKEGTNVVTYGALIGEYKIKDSNDNLKIIITSINENMIRLNIIQTDSETALETNFNTQLVSVANYKYNFTYHNETQTSKGTGILEIKNTKLYLTLNNDETAIEKILPELEDQELELG